MFDGIEHLGHCLISRVSGFARDPRGLQRREPQAGAASKLSMAALSQTLPERLIKQLTPLSAIESNAKPLKVSDTSWEPAP